MLLPQPVPSAAVTCGVWASPGSRTGPEKRGKLSTLAGPVQSYTPIPGAAPGKYSQNAEARFADACGSNGSKTAVWSRSVLGSPWPERAGTAVRRGCRLYANEGMACADLDVACACQARRAEGRPAGRIDGTYGWDVSRAGLLTALVLAVVDGRCRSSPRSLRGRVRCGGRRGAGWACCCLGGPPDRP